MSDLLRRPLLYLSLYFKQHRQEYYRLLDQVRFEGDWEAWLDFFLEGVADTAGNAVDCAQRLVRQFGTDERKIQQASRRTVSLPAVFQAFCQQPLLSIQALQDKTGFSFPAIAKAVDKLCRLKIVEEITGRKRDRIYSYTDYIAILNEGAEPFRDSIA